MPTPKLCHHAPADVPLMRRAISNEAPTLISAGNQETTRQFGNPLARG
jgi:hypothetical protein